MIACKGAWHARAPRVVTSTKYLHAANKYTHIISTRTSLDVVTSNGCIVIKVPIIKHNRFFL